MNSSEMTNTQQHFGVATLSIINQTNTLIAFCTGAKGSDPWHPHQHISTSQLILDHEHFAWLEQALTIINQTLKPHALTVHITKAFIEPGETSKIFWGTPVQHWYTTDTCFTYQLLGNFSCVEQQNMLQAVDQAIQKALIHPVAIA